MRALTFMDSRVPWDLRRMGFVCDGYGRVESHPVSDKRDGRNRPDDRPDDPQVIGMMR